MLTQYEIVSRNHTSTLAEFCNQDRYCSSVLSQSSR